MEKKKKTQQRNETFMLRGCILGLKLAVGKKGGQKFCCCRVVCKPATTSAASKIGCKNASARSHSEAKKKKCENKKKPGCVSEKSSAHIRTFKTILSFFFKKAQQAYLVCVHVRNLKFN